MCIRDRDSAAQSIPAPNAKHYKDLNELLASDVDAVIIATPVFLHPEHLEACLLYTSYSRTNRFAVCRRSNSIDAARDRDAGDAHQLHAAAASSDRL